MPPIKKGKIRLIPVPGRRCKICQDQIYRKEEYDENIGWFILFDAMNHCEKSECKAAWKRKLEEDDEHQVHL